MENRPLGYGCYLGLPGDTVVRLDSSPPPVILPRFRFYYELYRGDSEQCYLLSLGAQADQAVFFFDELSRRVLAEPGVFWRFYRQGVETPISGIERVAAVSILPPAVEELGRLGVCYEPDGGGFERTGDACPDCGSRNTRQDAGSNWYRCEDCFFAWEVE